MQFFPILFAAVIGFGHAFEADHLVAVSSLVTKRSKLKLAVKDGIYWGLGHTSTILLVGIFIIAGKMLVNDTYFHYLESAVGGMLLLIGLFRFSALIKYRKHEVQHLINDEKHHHVAYGVGMVHGLAGSGVIILLVMSEIKQVFPSLLYLLIFGLGSVVGMLVASGIFSLPYTKLVTQNRNFQILLILFSAILCIFMGSRIIYQTVFSL